METRFFVEISDPSKQSLIGLQKLELDLFQPTAKANVEENNFTIEGLVPNIRGLILTETMTFCGTVVLVLVQILKKKFTKETSSEPETKNLIHSLVINKQS
jgi:hypothetical protein